MYKISQDGIELLKSLEGFKGSWYPDSEGNPTIGYGHLKRKSDTFTSLTEEEAENLLRQDIHYVETFLNTLNLELEQNEYDALVCLVFNIGTGQFSTSTVLKLIKLNDDINTIIHWAEWVHITKNGQKIKCQGLANRRRLEMNLFNKVDRFMTNDEIIKLTTIIQNQMEDV